MEGRDHPELQRVSYLDSFVGRALLNASCDLTGRSLACHFFWSVARCAPPPRRSVGCLGAPSLEAPRVFLFFPRCRAAHRG